MRVKDFWHWLEDEGKEVAENATIGELETLFTEFAKNQNENKHEGENHEKPTRRRLFRTLRQS